MRVRKIDSEVNVLDLTDEHCTEWYPLQQEINSAVDIVRLDLLQ